VLRRTHDGILAAAVESARAFLCSVPLRGTRLGEAAAGGAGLPGGPERLAPRAPDAIAQLRTIDGELDPLKDMPEVHRELSRLLPPRHEPELRHGAEHEADLGIDIGGP
jgi:hypothetical protein